MLPGLMSLDFYIQMVGSEFGVNNLDTFCLLSTVHVPGDGSVMAQGMFSLHTFGLLVSTRLNTTTYLCMVAGHVLPFVVCPSTDGRFQAG